MTPAISKFCLCLSLVFLSFYLFAQTGLGTIIESTNLALPSSYDFKEYVFAEPDDQGDCDGTLNATATIEEVFISQTHRHAVNHPFFFTIGHRPFLLQLAITGSGDSPDVTVEARMDGTLLGNFCLKGPQALSAAVDLDVPDFENYFSVTIPKDWVVDGLELIVSAGLDSKTISSEELKIGPYTEMNLVMVNMDVMDYNGQEHQWPVFDDFLEEMASAIPASVVRFGIFPEPLKFPEVIANNGTEQVVRLSSRSKMNENGIFSDGSINSIATLFLGNLHNSTADYLSTIYFGNTLNLAPGGWGGGKSFVSFDYTDIFIHELGHALSLPHWGEGSYGNSDAQEWEFNYPYGGEDDNGGGRGTAWNFIQHTNEFVSPICQDVTDNNLGDERSDCMQRNNACIESRSNDNGPWDGYGDFSALAIHRYLTGGDVKTGKVMDRGEEKDYQLRAQGGFPIMSLENGERVYTRDPLQSQEQIWQEHWEYPGEEQIEQEVYLVYGTVHESQEQANIVYKPIKYTGTLPAIIDPTDEETFEALKDPEYLQYLFGTRDITLKLTYEDGSVLHALNPFHSFARAPYTWGYHIWRDDICNFSLAVPADKNLQKVEVYKRPFCVRWDDDDTPGNINYAAHGITAENFMDGATFLTEYIFGGPKVLGSNTIGNRVWHDLNQDGFADPNEPGIADVSLVLWRDGDGDGIPDWQGFGGVVKTDENGYYSFSGLGPGNYLVFVWSVDNWEEGQPLHGMVPTPIFESDPNTDLNSDNNGRPGGEWGLTDIDIVSGMISLTEDGEPLGDGDREDEWFDYDPSGNMTIDFGFYVEGATDVQDLAEDGFKVYPNPFDEHITVEIDDFGNLHLEIYDAKGALVHSRLLTAQLSRVNMRQLEKGLYFIVIRNSKRKILRSKKLIK